MGREYKKVWERVVALRKHKAVVVVGAGLLVIVGVQLMYPSDKVLPFARLDDAPVGLMSAVDVEKKIAADYTNGTVETTVRSDTSKTPFAETGIVTDNKTILAGLTEYPWYLRVIPLSSVVKGALTNQSVRATVDDERFVAFAQTIEKKCLVPAKNAGAKVERGTVVLDPAADGETCTNESLKTQVVERPLQKNSVSYVVALSPLKPERSDSDVSGLLTEANVLAGRRIAVTVGGTTYTPDRATVAGWLAFVEDDTTSMLRVGLNDDAVKKYLETIQKEVYVAPGVTYVTTHDGIETGRSVGASGRGVDIAVTTEALKKQIQAGDGTVVATPVVLAPSLKYSRTYSRTPAGLQALVDDLVRDKNMAISVRKLGDSGVSANGSKQYHPASTYKLFAAYSVMKRVDSGQMSWAQTASGGQTVAQCFDKMIVYSDNACAEWFGATIGWNAVTADARSAGASGATVLSQPFVSTANDLATFLQKLESNQLGVSEASRARLLDAMKRQIYRQGVPAGVGVTVANKVGFLEGTLHDAAIVYAPSGVYVVVIMSDGQSWGVIADAARQLHAQLTGV